jgi:hypothetical protein
MTDGGKRRVAARAWRTTDTRVIRQSARPGTSDSEPGAVQLRTADYGDTT